MTTRSDKRDRLFEIVGDEQHRLAVGAPQVEQQIAHDLAGLRVERPERLVHQQDLRIADQHLREADALALPAREHVRIAIGEGAEADARQPFLRAFVGFCASYARRLEADRDIVDRSLPRKQRVGLKQVAGLRVNRRKRRAVNVGLPCRGRNQPGGNVEQCGLAAAGRADDRDELAVGDLERRVLHRAIDAAIRKPKRHIDIGEIDRRRHAPSPHPGLAARRQQTTGLRRAGKRAGRGVSPMWRACHHRTMSDPRIADAFARLPDYLGGHVLVSVTALLIGLAVSLPLGVAAARRPKLRNAVLGTASVIQTIPGLALLTLFYPLLLALAALSQQAFGYGFSALGFLPAVLALAFYSMLPVLRNTVTGLNAVSDGMRDSARALGLRPRQILGLVELPLAAPVIMAGIRTAAVWVIGTATLSTPIGQTSLGNYIFAGLQTQNWVFVLFGCVAAAALAIAVDQLLALMERGVATRSRGRLIGGALGIAALVIAALAPGLRGRVQPTSSAPSRSPSNMCWLR